LQSQEFKNFRKISGIHALASCDNLRG